MRSALLISGNPRFTENFDLQLQNLQNSDIDWYITLWRRGESQDNRTSKNWVDVETAEHARSLIEPHLPSNHVIKHIDLLDPAQYNEMPREYDTRYIPVIFLWQQFISLKICDHARRNLGIQYDLVIRSRPDLGLDRPIFLDLAKQWLLSNPNTVITPDNQRHGITPFFCDQFAIGLPNIMEKYCDAIDLFDDMYLNGVDYNPERLMQSVLQLHKISYPVCNFNIVRDERYWVITPHGRWGELTVKK
jgi:hypothetical protein